MFWVLVYCPCLSSLLVFLFWLLCICLPYLLSIYRNSRLGRFFLFVFVARRGLLGFYTQMAFRALVSEAVFPCSGSGHSSSTTLAFHRFFPPVFRSQRKSPLWGSCSRYQISTLVGCLETLLLEFISRGSYEPLGHFSKQRFLAVFCRF